MVNKVTLIGRVGKDPEVRSTPSGTKVAQFSLATSRKWKDNNNQQQEETEWHRLVVFGRRAEVIEQYVQKGSLLYVEGRIHYNQWEDKDGVKKTFTDIIIENFNFLDSKGSSSGGGNSGSYSRNDNYQKNNQSQQSSQNNFDGGNDSFDDDVPF